MMEQKLSSQVFVIRRAKLMSLNVDGRQQSSNNIFLDWKVTDISIFLSLFFFFLQLFFRRNNVLYSPPTFNLASSIKRVESCYLVDESPYTVGIIDIINYAMMGKFIYRMGEKNRDKRV